jgi:hypothetical protein
MRRCGGVNADDRTDAILSLLDDVGVLMPYHQTEEMERTVPWAKGYQALQAASPYRKDTPE